MRQIGIAIPSYNRSHLTVDSFSSVYDDERIKQITIVDDDSNDVYFKELKELVEDKSKVKLWRNDDNMDCFRNKWVAMCYSDCHWNILLDSDNKIDKSYLDILYSFDEWDENTIYTPSFASPHFDFRAYEGMAITKENISEHIDKPMFEVCLNAANFFINRKKYLEVWDDEQDPVTSDSIYFISQWIEAGNKLYIVPSLTYQHRVHEDSHYQKNQHRTPQGFHQSILQKLRELK